MSDSQRAQLKIVVDTLVEEARRSWTSSHTWPRQTSNFSGSAPNRLPPEVITEALGHRLHDLSAVDGYVKWQLMSFAPSVEQLKRPTLGWLLAGMPTIVRNRSHNSGARQGKLAAALSEVNWAASSWASSAAS